MMMNIPQLVGGEIHAMEVAEHIASLHILSNQTELAEGPANILLLLLTSGIVEFCRV